MTYAARHRLLPEALKLWAGSARESDVLEAYGEDLLERREWRAAALGECSILPLRSSTTLT
jgi:hypothetical protein